MITASALLETGVRSLRAAQMALSVTSHNITNVNTDGFSRQRADLVTALPLPSAPGMLGTGVDVTNVSRLRATFLDTTIRSESSLYGLWDEKRENLAAVESVLGDPTLGNIGNQLSSFFDAWHDLTANPEQIGARQAVIESAQTLVDGLHDFDSRLTTLNNGLNLKVSSTVDETNTLLTSIATLNQEIARQELDGSHANDLRDRRDLLVERLAEITDITVTETANGMVNIETNGDVLVNQITASSLTAVLNGATGHMEAHLGAAELAFASGRFQGFKDSFAEIDSARADMDQLASMLITEVNTLHTTGFDLNGVAAGDFFSGTDAGDIAVLAAVAADPTLLAASTTNAPGGNGMALQIAQLRGKKVYPAGTPVESLNERFGSMVQEIGALARQANQNTENFQIALDQVKEQRNSISGVSLDEEVSNMLAFQRAYEASARVITTVDEMMDQIINRTGRVGL